MLKTFLSGGRIVRLIIIVVIIIKAKQSIVTKYVLCAKKKYKPLYSTFYELTALITILRGRYSYPHLACEEMRPKVVKFHSVSD